jgi:hypothetical protein
MSAELTHAQEMDRLRGEPVVRVRCGQPECPAVVWLPMMPKAHVWESLNQEEGWCRTRGRTGWVCPRHAPLSSPKYRRNP